MKEHPVTGQPIMMSFFHRWRDAGFLFGIVSAILDAIFFETDSLDSPFVKTIHWSWIIGKAWIYLVSAFQILEHAPGLSYSFVLHPNRFLADLYRCLYIDFGCEFSAVRMQLLFVPVCLLIFAFGVVFGLTQYTTCFAVGLFAIGFQSLLMRATPPCVLVLGVSAKPTTDPVHLQLALMSALSPRRVVSLLHPKTVGIEPLQQRVAALDSYRTLEYAWPTWLRYFIEMAPVILLDLRVITAPVEYEYELVVMTGLLYKTLLVVGDRDSCTPVVLRSESESGTMIIAECRVQYGEAISLASYMTTLAPQALPTEQNPVGNIRYHLVQNDKRYADLYGPRKKE